MDITEVLRSAWAAVQEAGLPPELQEAGFKEAVKLLAGEGGATPTQAAGTAAPAPKPASKRQTPPAARAKIGGRGTSPPTPISNEDFFTRLESGSGVPREKLERVFDLVDHEPQITLVLRRLGNSRKAQMQAVAQLITVARFHGLDEGETSTRVIREECRRLKCLDDNNINAYLESGLEGISYIGSKNDRRLRVGAQGDAGFEKVVAKVLGEATKPAA